MESQTPDPEQIENILTDLVAEWDAFPWPSLTLDGRNCLTLMQKGPDALARKAQEIQGIVQAAVALARRAVEAVPDELAGRHGKLEIPEGFILFAELKQRVAGWQVRDGAVNGQGVFVRHGDSKSDVGLVAGRSANFFGLGRPSPLSGNDRFFPAVGEWQTKRGVVSGAPVGSVGASHRSQRMPVWLGVERRNDGTVFSGMMDANPSVALTFIGETTRPKSDGQSPRRP